MFAQQSHGNSRAGARILATIRSRATALRPARSVLAAVAVAATGLAATATFGGAAASAAAVQAAHAARAVRAQLPGHDASGRLPITGVTWHPLSLLNGWQSSEGQFGTGDPAWAVKNGIVYLSGSMHQAAGSVRKFAVLPLAARPAHYQYLTVYTDAASYGYIEITPSGVMYASSSQGSARSFTSLAAVSFPAAATASQSLTLLNGWQSSQGQYNTGDPAWTVKNGIVYLSGSLHQPSGTDQEALILPPGARPPATDSIIVYTLDGATGELQINPDGTLLVFAPTAAGSEQQYTSLAGVSFPATTTGSTTLTLLGGWVTDGLFPGNPSYTVANGVVYLSGGMHQPSGSGIGFAVLPAGARPAHTVYIKMDANGAAGGLEIDTSGNMYAWSSPDATRAQQDTELGGISYPVNS